MFIPCRIVSRHAFDMLAWTGIVICAAIFSPSSSNNVPVDQFGNPIQSTVVDSPSLLVAQPDQQLNPPFPASQQNLLLQPPPLQNNAALNQEIQQQIPNAQNTAEQRVVQENARAVAGAAPGSTADLLCQAYFSGHGDLRNVSHMARVSLETAAELVKSNRFLSLSQVNAKLQRCPLTQVTADLCRQSIRYRRPDGLCNNLADPHAGSSGERLLRMMPPNYSDGFQSVNPVMASSGRILKSPRTVSTAIAAGSTPKVGRLITSVLPHWWHLVTSDLVALRSESGPSGRCLDCCGSDMSNPKCFPVSVLQSDATFGSLGCLPYARLLPGVKRDCSIGPRTPANSATAFLDLSHLYGSTDAEAKAVRENQGGRLLMTGLNGDSAELLPPLVQAQAKCRSQQCFGLACNACNFLPGTAILHTVLMREHNRIAAELSSLNPHWTDEKLFQEARRINTAVYQHITMNELLPLLVGQNRVAKLGLQADGTDYFAGYNPSVEAQAIDGFAGAAGLIHHALWPEPLEPNRQESISDALYSSDTLLVPGRFDETLRMMTRTHPGKLPGFTNQKLMTSFLASSQGGGTDLLATLVNLGRDMGLQTFEQWRQKCAMPPTRSFAELTSEARLRDQLQTVYDSTADVELLVGGLAENPEPGCLLGPTMACIVAAQFQRIKLGDRHWYETYMQPVAFSRAQLSEIRKQSLARVFCDNTGVTFLQPFVMTAPDSDVNSPIVCRGSAIPKLELSHWKDAEPRVEMPISDDTIKQVQNLATEVTQQRVAREIQNMQTNANFRAPPKSATASVRALQLQTPQTKQKQNNAHMMLEMTMLIAKRRGLLAEELNLDRNELEKILPLIDVSTFVADIPEDKCSPQMLPCDHTAKYRTMTGWCNNLLFPHQGQASRPFRRMLSPTYQDGFSAPRVLSTLGTPLPSARLISNKVMFSTRNMHPKFTHITMLWGQFIDHDITLTPVANAPDGTFMDCSSCDSEQTVSSNCLPIPIPPDDSAFPTQTSNGRPTCMPFVRSAIGQLSLGFREQINQITSYMDGSNVYGSDECHAKKLRAGQAGLLRTVMTTEGTVLMPNNDEVDACRSNAPHSCFTGGDARVNEHMGLASMHTLFLREHNRLALKLGALNPFWDDETIYQETRKIVGALIQKITFDEFLPRIIGLKEMEKHDLLTARFGYYENYNDTCDATTSNEFATAAYRFGHTMITTMFARRGPNGQPMQGMSLLEIAFNATALYNKGECGRLLMGFVKQNLPGMDRHFDDVLRNRLFEFKGHTNSGLDLPALNVQRGRDHGLPTWAQIRRLAGLPVPATWDQMGTNIFDAETVSQMRQVYASVEDIDLFPGLVSEHAQFGSAVGPSLVYMLGDQFGRMRKCDRFWFENGNDASRFTPGQLAQIRRASLANIMCRNLKEVKKIQPWVMTMPDELRNQPIECDQIPDIDLTAWAERNRCTIQPDTQNANSVVLNQGDSASVSPCVSCTCTRDGAVCQSINVKNCMGLFKTNPIRDVTADGACMAQCSPVFVARGLNI